MEWMEVVDVINGKTEDFKNCVYMWRNKVNEKLYVGQAKNFRKRTKQHKNEAFNKKQKAYHYSINKSIRKYGIENFEICILEYNLNGYDEMNEKEIYYIEKFDTLANNKKGYNVASGGGNANIFAGKTEEEIDEYRRKLSGENSALFGCTGEKHPRSIKVICITTEKIYGSTMEAERQTGINGRNISTCCRGERNSAGVIDGKPAIWMYLEDYENLSEEIIKIKNQEAPNGGRPKAVICTTTRKIYESTHEAERQTGINRRSISYCCNKNYKTVKDPITGEKLIFMFLDEYLESK